MKENDPIRNVNGSDAIEVVKKLCENVHTCLMLTTLDKKPISVHPMAIQKVDDSGRIYFMSSRNSGQNQELVKDNTMQLTIQNEGSSEYISLFGKAEIYRDQKEIDEMYSMYVNTWFDGKEDPNITIIRFESESGYYWETKHGKMVQMAGFLIGALTGKETDDSLEGKIKV